MVAQSRSLQSDISLAHMVRPRAFWCFVAAMGNSYRCVLHSAIWHKKPYQQLTGTHEVGPSVWFVLRVHVHRPTDHSEWPAVLHTPCNSKHALALSIIVGWVHVFFRGSVEFSAGHMRFSLKGSRSIQYRCCVLTACS